jgi:hypothetical protein
MPNWPKRPKRLRRARPSQNEINATNGVVRIPFYRKKWSSGKKALTFNKNSVYIKLNECGNETDEYEESIKMITMLGTFEYLSRSEE